MSSPTASPAPAAAEKPASPVPAASEAPAAAASTSKDETAAPASSATEDASAPAAATQEQAPTATAAAASAAPAAGNPGGNASASANNAPGASTSLYVGELDAQVTEAMLFEIFSMMGPVISIRVCRDAVTRRSLGYAYVNYMNALDAERALDQLNYSLIKNKPCRIMWSQRDPALRKTGAGNVFIKNLDETIDNKALHDTFVAFGPIVSCKVATDEHGKSRGYGFVHYETTESAEQAIDQVNGMMLADKVVYVGKYVPKRERQAKIDEVKSKFTNLYVKNLPLDTSDDEFRKLFEKYGSVTSAVIQPNTVEVDGKQLKFGFVNFEEHDAAKKALDELHDSKLRDETLYVTRAQKKGEREEELRKSYEAQKYEKTLKYQGVNLYVKNLDDDMDEDKLQAEFAAYGTITSCKIMKDDKLASRGFGFVCFSSPDEATKAVTEMNGKMIGSKPLYVSLAQRKDVRKQQLEAQVAQRTQIRNQQMAAAGIPGVPFGVPNGAPMYYGQPGQFPPQGRGGPMMYPQGPGGMMMPGQPGGPGGRQPRYAPAGQMPGMGPMGPYGPVQGYPGYGPGQNGMPGGPGGRGGPMNGGRPGPGGPMGGNMPNGGAPRMPNGAPGPQQQQQQCGRPPVGGAPAGPGSRAGPPAGAGPRGPGGPGAYRSGPNGAPQQGGPQQGGPQQQGQAGQQQQQKGEGQQQQQAAAPLSDTALTAQQLVNASPAEQKQILGETIYPKIHASQPDLAGKITGMLLEMDNSELLNLLEDDAALESKVQEAMSVLEAYNKKPE